MAQKKVVDFSVETKRALIEPAQSGISLTRQCELVALNRSSFYYKPANFGESEQNLLLMRLLDEQYTRTPFYGIRRMTAWLRTQGQFVTRKRVARLLRKMGLNALYPKPNLSLANPTHKIYPYLLRGVKIERVNQVWSTDITYLRIPRGFVYLVAVIDWFSRYVISWEVSISLDTSFCLQALDRALEQGRPEIFNTDQGSHTPKGRTSLDFTSRLLAAEIRISMDGRGRALDNIFVERLWRSVKQEEVYIKDYRTVAEAVVSLKSYFDFYNLTRLHQSLDYVTPASVYFES